MRRFFLQPSEKLEADNSVSLTGDEFHHLRNVSRLEAGERVELLDGKGKIALATIREIGKKAAWLDVNSVHDVPPMSKPHIEIILCVPRFQKVDLIIQKSAELGAVALTPVVSDRSFIKTLSKDNLGKVSRWEKIATEACKQSGRAWPLHVNEFSTLEDKISQTPKGQGLFLYEGETALDIQVCLSQWKNPEKISVFIGAEGGFSPAEVEKFQSCGMGPVTLGPLVLRVETACIAILSVIQYHFGGMRQ
jgi:16S rRNA (uracil1498-N3)-methyltransferase